MFELLTGLVAAGALAAWLWLALAHGRFWEAVLPEPACEPETWPAVVVIIPARNEAETMAEVVQGVLAQDYPGKLRLIVVDDNSSDGTGEKALGAAAALGEAERLSVVVTGEPLEGWSGKVRAMQCGWETLCASEEQPELVWFTDADISHQPAALRDLVARLKKGNYAMVSSMVRLRCETFWERVLVPAFVYFFKLLYPFREVARAQSRTAGAAGGSMLVKFETLQNLGGLTVIRDALIDDCALARAIKRSGGGIRLDLTDTSKSLRGYPRLLDAWNTVARTAYTQLKYSPWRLAGCTLGLGWLFFWPPLALIVGSGLPSLAGGLAWLIMMATFVPMLRFYRLSIFWALLLPGITLIYLGATLDSARRYYAGRGGAWKQRVYSK